MRKVTIVIFTALLYTTIQGQTVSDLYTNKDFQALIKLEEKADTLATE